MIQNLVSSSGNSETENYYLFQNPFGQQWLLPTNQMRLGMNLYHPSALKGKLVKYLFPIKLFRKSIAKVIGAELKSVSISDELNEIFKKVWPGKKLSYSFFGGTPGIHRKGVIQISENNNILAYCKISNNKEVGTLFDKEASILKRLHEHGFNNVPKLLFRGTSSSGLEVFTQSSVKFNDAKLCRSWTPAHQAFIDKLISLTSSEIPFEDSAIYKNLLALMENIDLFPIAEERDFLLDSAKKIQLKYSNKTIKASLSHGDFTPWNSYMCSNVVYVYDWEYFTENQLSNYDKYHFIIQNSLYKYKGNLRKMIREVTASEYGLQRDIIEMYVIDFIARMFLRDKGTESTDFNLRAFRIWPKFLRKIQHI